MPDLSLAQLHEIMPKLPIRDADRYLAPLNKAMRRWGIVTPNQQAAFLACMAHPSRQLRRWRTAKSGLEQEFNLKIGNTFPGDGPKYKAGGPISIEGRSQYNRASLALAAYTIAIYDTTLVRAPSLITLPEVGLQVAAWFWAKEENCLPLANSGTKEGLWFCYCRVTEKYSGKVKGWKAVRDCWKRARRVLGATES